MIEDSKRDATVRMAKCLEALKTELGRLRTGRAHPSLLEQVVVEYYGTPTPLQQVANIAVEDARTLSVTPWEKNLVQSIEKAILGSGLGLNPATSGTVIRIPLPPLTEERRRDLTKIVRQEAESARIAIRNVRRDANNHLKDLLKDKKISEDDERKAQENIQKLTDKHIMDVDKLCQGKEKDLLEV